MPSDDVVSIQDGFIAGGVYPERVKLEQVATLGAIADFLATKTPTLMLEIGLDSTQSFIITAAGVDASRPIPSVWIRWCRLSKRNWV